MFRCLSWDPLSIVAEGRAEDLSSDTDIFDLLALKGTQRRACTSDGVVTFHHGNHTEYSVG